MCFVCRYIDIGLKSKTVCSSSAVAAGTGAKGSMRPERHLEGRNYLILKFGRFWRIGICIADSDILTPLHVLKTPQFYDHTP